MTHSHSIEAADLAASPRYLPVLLLLFVGSGCSALIYEIVWFQLLQLVIGSSAVSLGVLLGTFMGGMCLGSVVLPRVISARRHPLRVYAFLEAGIGIFGLLILFGMPYVDRIYVASLGYGLPGILLRGVVCGVCLLPPTLLMGATLPAIARWIKTTPRDVSWLGFFYGGNITGAVFGCLLAGFYLLRVHDVAIATYVAAVVNGAVALVGWSLASWSPEARPGVEPDLPGLERAPGSWWVYATIALSGFCALSAEVIWTRLLSLLFGATVYTFSIILAGFLLGLGIGSSIGSLLARGAARPRLMLAICQLLLTAGIAWTAFIMTRSLPYWPIVPSMSTSPWFNFQLDLLRCLWAILPATILWGASFPLALAAVASRGQDPGRLVGGVYAANTVGALAGALGSGLFLIPWAGTQGSQRLLVGLSATSAILMFASLFWSRGRASPNRGARNLIPWFAGVAAAGLAGSLAWTIPPVPGELIAWGRQLPSRSGEADIIYVGEGINASVAVSERADVIRNFHVSGKIEASTYPEDMRLQRMLGHLSALMHAKPRKVLVVGCGAGVTAGTFVLHPDVEKVVICEIEPLIPKVVAEFFTEENYNVLRDPRVEVIYDDARHYVLTTREKFDVITSDPIHPWVKGAATLYTREYFEMCKQHLNPGGLVTQWVPLYESDVDTVRSEIATFFEVFPNGSIWSNCVGGEGYDAVLLGQEGARAVDVDEFTERLQRPDHGRVAWSLQEVDFQGGLNLLATYAGRAADLKSWLEGALINRDRNLRLQYVAGLGLNSELSKWIYMQIQLCRTFPEDFFTGSDQQKQALRRLLESQPLNP